jgi:hypothetical protein
MSLGVNVPEARQVLRFICDRLKQHTADPRNRPCRPTP